MQERREINRQQKQDRRKAKKQNKNKQQNMNFEIKDTDLKSDFRSSQQELVFEKQVEINIKEQDQLLDEINTGLTDLQQLATDANKQLTVQKSMFETFENKMDITVQKLKSSNRRLQEMLDENGGCSRFCPMILCLIILLSLIGYMFHMF